MPRGRFDGNWGSLSEVGRYLGMQHILIDSSGTNVKPVRRAFAGTHVGTGFIAKNRTRRNQAILIASMFLGYGRGTPRFGRSKMSL